MSKTMLKKIGLREHELESENKSFLCLEGGWDLPLAECDILFDSVIVNETKKYLINFLLRPGEIRESLSANVEATVNIGAGGVTLWAAVTLPGKAEIMSGFGMAEAGSLPEDVVSRLTELCGKSCRRFAEAALGAAWRKAWKPAAAAECSARISAELAEKIRTAELLYTARKYAYICDDGRFYRQPVNGGSWEIVKAPAGVPAYKEGENVFGFDDSRTFFVEDGRVTGGTEVRNGTTYYTTPYEWLPAYNCYSNVTGMVATFECWARKLWEARN